jgi:hypothetical protein
LRFIVVTSVVVVASAHPRHVQLIRAYAAHQQHAQLIRRDTHSSSALHGASQLISGMQLISAISSAAVM